MLNSFAEGEDQFDLAFGTIEPLGDLVRGESRIGEGVRLGVLRAIGSIAAGVVARWVALFLRQGAEARDALIGLLDESLEAGGAGVELSGDLLRHLGEFGEQGLDLALDIGSRALLLLDRVVAVQRSLLACWREGHHTPTRVNPALLKFAVTAITVRADVSRMKETPAARSSNTAVRAAGPSGEAREPRAPGGPGGHGVPRAPLVTIVICAGLLLAFAGLAHTAVISKSPTFDEPLHALSAWLHLHFSDFRIDPEDPPLWKYFAALPNGKDAIQFPNRDAFIHFHSGDVFMEWPLVVRVLYQTPGNVEVSDHFINRSRNMMLIVGVGLGIIIAFWSWRLGGAQGGVAAVVACMFFALDPNFLGHAPLVKNDVSFALVMLGLAYAVWRAGRRITIVNAAAIALLCAAAMNIKFSALLLGPIVAALLIIRALLPRPWPMLRSELRSIAARLGAAAGMGLLAAIVSYAGIWACYQFRFRPAPAPDATLDLQAQVRHAAENGVRSANPSILTPTLEQIGNFEKTRFTKSVMFLNEHRLLPESFLTGLLYTYQSSLARSTYLAGEYSRIGWWYYFPFAMGVKSPLSLLAAALASIAAAIHAFRARSFSGRFLDHPGVWTAACLIIPPAVYLAVAMKSNLNLGLRHVLPVYPFIFIAIGLAASSVWRRVPKVSQMATGFFALTLFIEARIAFPDYIAFFNGLVGGTRGGLYLLGDSNLDWGQDLKLLARWQQKNPGIPLYLVYFGIADPSAYGIEYVNFPGGWMFNPKFEIRTDPGILAISATNLQGIYLSKDARDAYAIVKKREPLEVLGGSIYLYEWPPTGMTFNAATTTQATQPATHQP